MTEKSSQVVRALNILEVVAKSSTALTATEINERLKLPTATIHRLCALLEKEGYLQPKLGGNGYQPGNLLSEISKGVFRNSDQLSNLRHSILQSLSDEIGETCNISIPVGTEMIYFDRVETQWGLRAQLKINDRVPMYCTAGGKLYLSSLVSDSRTRLINNMKLEQRTENTMTDPVELKAALKKLRKDEVGIDNEEFMTGMIAVSVPLKNAEGLFYAALAMHAPSARISLEKALSYVPRLREAAFEMTQLINK